MKRIVIFLCLLCTLLMCSCSVQTYADGEVGGDTLLSDAAGASDIGFLVCGERITLQKDADGEGYTLYLPSFADDITWSIEKSILFEGKTVNDGESARGLLELENADIGGFDVKIMRSANIASMFLQSDDGNMDKINSSADHSYGTGGSYSLISPEGEVLSAGKLKKIRGRGNATWNGAEKKPYQIELSSPSELLGLAKAKKYILLANYYDPSLLRNSIAFEIAAAYEGYSVSGEPLDLYACGEYLGSYLLCEKIDIAENKIDIFDLENATEDLLQDKAEEYPREGAISGAEAGGAKWFELPSEPKDSSGGYLLEVEYTERYPNEVSGFVTDRGLPIVILSPECASKKQVEYIKEYVCDFEDALYSPDGYNEKGKHYSDYADMESLAFRYLFEEFLLNIDGGVSSFHIYKDSDEMGGKLNFSCVWDYDCAFGNYKKYADLTSPEILFVGESETRNNGSMPSWFYAMLRRGELRELIKDCYNKNFRASVAMAISMLPSMVDRIRASAEMDHMLYGSFDERNFYGADCGSDFEDATAHLEDFIRRRLDFFDNIMKNNK